MTISVTDFRVRFPEFSDTTEYPDARIEMFIEDSADLYIGTDELRWGGKYDKAQAFLSAHLLTVGTGSEAGDSGAKVGPIQSKTAGGVSVTRAVAASTSRSDNDEFLMTTVYGQQFLTIRNRCFIGATIATC